jgi:hypothetical protein
MAELFRVRLDEAITEVERELHLRASFYPLRIRSRQMSRSTADRQMNRLEAAHGFLIELRTLKGGDHEQKSGQQGALAR